MFELLSRLYSHLPKMLSPEEIHEYFSPPKKYTSRAFQHTAHLCAPRATWPPSCSLRYWELTSRPSRQEEALLQSIIQLLGQIKVSRERKRGGGGGLLRAREKEMQWGCCA